MRNKIAVAALSGLFAVTALSTAALSQTKTAAPPAYAAAALADKSRPDADKARDAAREPAAMLTFAGIKPGSSVAEWIPGGGYFSRIFSKAVGPKGHVYVFATAPAAGRAAPAISAIAADANYKDNLTAVLGPLDQAKVPQPVDVVWTSQNYHDLPPATRTALNKLSFDMLKPGGVYIVLDHSAIVGTGDFAGVSQLHRIDENFVKLEVLQAGFKLAGESDVLRNPKDDRTKRVFDASLSRDTDQFVLKFQKPR